MARPLSRRRRPANGERPPRAQPDRLLDRAPRRRPRRTRSRPRPRTRSRPHAPSAAGARDHADLSLQPPLLSRPSTEHALDLRVAVERLHAELTAEPGPLEPAEGRRARVPSALELTQRTPASTARATRSARAPSRVQIDPDSPYGVPLARRTASSSVRKGITAATGPNTSSRAMRSSFEASTTVQGKPEATPRVAFRDFAPESDRRLIGHEARDPLPGAPAEMS